MNIYLYLLRRECVVVINAVIVASSNSFNGDRSYEIHASNDCENGVFFNGWLRALFPELDVSVE